MKKVNRLKKQKKLFILAIAFALLAGYILVVEPVFNLGEIIGRFLYQITH